MEQVIFTLNVPLTPTIFTLAGENPRMVFDFADATISRKVSSVYPAGGKLIKRIRVGLHKGATPKTRVVLDLTTPNGISVDQSFNDQASVLTVTLKNTELVIKPVKTKAKISSSTSSSEMETAKPTSPAAEQSTENSTVDILKEPEPEPAPVQAAPAVTDSASEPGKDDSPQLQSIIFDNATDNGEMVVFQLNGFYPPTVKGIEEENPRAICDFKQTAIAPEVGSIEETDGKFVKSIRVGKHADPDMIRVVIDLAPNKNYDLQQVFFKEDNLFVIIVNAQASQKLKKINN